MYSCESNEKNAIQRTYGSPHFNMYYPMSQQQLAYNMNYSQSMHYNVYPSHLICDNSFVNNAITSIDVLRARQENEQAIGQFIQENELKDSTQGSRKKDPCKIATMRSALISVARLNKELGTIWIELKNNIDLPDAQWQEKMSACEATKNEIRDILHNINDADFMNKVKKDLEKRKKKRLREQSKREKWKEEKATRAERSARLHAKADSWIRKEQAVIEREKQEEKLRKDADMILSDVRGKRNDARKYLGILQELQNLRRIKMNIARARGEHLSSAVDEAFHNIIGNILSYTTFYQYFAHEFRSVSRARRDVIIKNHANTRYQWYR